MRNEPMNRRSALRHLAMLGGGALAASVSRTAADEPSALSTVAASRPARPSDWRAQLRNRIASTPLVDSHEHLIEESGRLEGSHPLIATNDWSAVFSHYLQDDLAVAGMPDDLRAKFYGPDVDPVDKWELLAPYWPRVRQTGYGQACAITLRELYGVGELDANTVRQVQQGYEQLIRPGFYRKVLVDVARLHSCQVNSLEAPFMESGMPGLLLQDIGILGMHMNPNIQRYAEPAGMEVDDLADWHAVIDWWFERYGPYAVAVKTQAAYMRDVDFEDVPPEKAAPMFRNFLNDTPMSFEDHLRLQGHLFWYCVRKAAEHQLPVKLHLGYYVGYNSMPFNRVEQNVGSISNVLRRAAEEVPDAHFVLMHIAYPRYEDLIAVAKHYSNCTIDMCWGWIINPTAGVEFLKHFLAAVPRNKVLTFGGDYIPVEPVVGHAAMARMGILQALTELVEQDWLGFPRAMDMVDPLMRGNGNDLFQLEQKQQACRNAPWAP